MGAINEETFLYYRLEAWHMSSDNTRRKFLASAAAAASLGGISGCTGSSSWNVLSGGGGEFPTGGNDISTYIPYSEGGGFDTVIRGLAPILEDSFSDLEDVDVNVVPENVTGGGGVRNYNQHSTREPNGYHVSGMHGTAAPLNQILEIGEIQYDVRDFYYIGQMELNIKTLVSKAEDDQMTWKEIQSIGEQKGLHIATSGTGSPGHIFGEIISDQTGMETSYVHYGGVAPAMEGMIRGEADWVIANYASALPWAEGGDVTYHISFEDEKPPLDGPDVYTAADEGLPKWELIANLVNTIKVMALPPEPADEVTSIWEEVFKHAVTSEEYQNWAKENRRPITYAGNANEIIQNVYESQKEVKSMLSGMIDE